MKGHSRISIFCAILCLMMVIAEVTQAAPSYADYENSIRELYDLLVQKEALEERLGAHEMVRKASRSPSLRLRFGRRSDPSLMPASPFLYQATPQEAVERSAADN